MVITDDEKFVYVFSKKARDKMMKAGYQLVRSDDNAGQYVFENNPTLTFSKTGVKDAVKSNTLTF